MALPDTVSQSEGAPRTISYTRRPVAQSGHTELHRTCPLSGVKRTLCGLAVTLLSTQADILIALTDICAFECFRDKADISE